MGKITVNKQFKNKLNYPGTNGKNPNLFAFVALLMKKMFTHRILKLCIARKDPFSMLSMLQPLMDLQLK